MNSAVRRISILAAVVALVISGAARSASDSTEPPLLPGEVYLTTPKGCGYIVSESSIKSVGGGTAEGFFKWLKGLNWQEPPCVNGLLHGVGTYGSQDFTSRYAYAYGRELGGSSDIVGVSGKEHPFYNSGCSATGCTWYASLDGLGSDYAPHWDPNAGVSGGSSLVVGENKVYLSVDAKIRSCEDSIVPVKKCGPKNHFDVYGVYERSWQALENGEYPELYERFTACPDPLSPTGCEGLWRQIAGPSIAKTQTIIAQAAAEREAKLAEYAALTAPWIARRGELYRARAQALAQGQAQQIVDSLAAADGRARASAQAEVDFRKSLASRNAGQLFAMADELAAAGDNARARETFRTLVSRFPDHALASTAAMRLSSLGGAATSAGAAKVSARYSSVCVRNMQKVENALTAANNMNYAASNDSWLIQVNDQTARLYQPCIAYDKEAADNYDRAVKEAARIRQYCAGAHASHECLPWGYANGAANQRWYSVWDAEMKRSQADPNYSADLGTAKGPNGAVIGAGAQQAGSPDGDAHELCRAELHRLGDEFNRHRSRIPADQTVPLMELILWYDDAAYDAIQERCPAVEAYKSDLESYRTTYRATINACNQIATRTCEPRLPN
ncbi:MAG TPA: hypothetical protein VF138_09895 [Caulobacteraceae bacterium]